MHDSHIHLNLDKCLLTFDESVEFVDLYLRFVHDRPHSLFHEDTLHQDLNTGNVDSCLLHSICAIGCRFATRVIRPAYVEALMTKASVLFSQQLEEMNLSKVQAAILLANGYAAKQDNDLEALYFGR